MCQLYLVFPTSCIMINKKLGPICIQTFLKRKNIRVRFANMAFTSRIFYHDFFLINISRDAFHLKLKIKRLTLRPNRQMYNSTNTAKKTCFSMCFSLHKFLREKKFCENIQISFLVPKLNQKYYDTEYCQRHVMFGYIFL